MYEAQDRQQQAHWGVGLKAGLLALQTALQSPKPWAGASHLRLQ